MTTTTTLRCPACGCAEIVQWDLVPEKFPVTGLDDAGEPIIAEECGELVPDGRAPDPVSTYACASCAHGATSIAPFVVAAPPDAAERIARNLDHEHGPNCAYCASREQDRGDRMAAYGRIK